MDRELAMPLNLALLTTSQPRIVVASFEGNTATLTVEPPSTTATADSESTATEQQESTKVEIPPGKTPEELEQEAKNKGWLSIKHEFTWWYPWYRMHFKFTMNNAKIDVGFNPVLPGGEKVKYSGLEDALPKLAGEPDLAPEEAADIAETAIIEASISTLVLATSAVAAANLRVSTPLALAAYTCGLATLLGVSIGYQISSQNLKSKAFLTGLIVDLWGVALATVAPFTAGFFFDVIVFNILGIIASNLVEPSTLKASLIACNAVIITSLTLGVMGLLLPDPASATFRQLFLILTLGTAAMAMALLLAW
jgi:hypothetical protein